MPPRSKVTTMLPAYIRQEIERRLFENGFRDYEGLAQWVRGQGYEISDDSLWRYGRALQQQLAAAQLTMRHARALAKLGGNDQGLTAQALITVSQQRALAALLEIEEVKPAHLNAVANLTRAATALQRWAAELKARDEQQHTPAAKPDAPPDQPQTPNPQPTPAQRQPARATGSIPTVEAERKGNPPAGYEPGDDNDLLTREISTTPGADSLAVPGNAPIVAILLAPLRGSPRIRAMVIHLGFPQLPLPLRGRG